MKKIISYEAKIEFMKFCRDDERDNKHPSAVMMCSLIIEDLARLRDLEK
jgi:hypothetical protein